MEPFRSISYRAFKRYISEKGILLSESQINIAAHILDLNLSNPDPIDDTLINSVRGFIVDRHEHLDTLIGCVNKLHEMSLEMSRIAMVTRDKEEFEARMIEIGYNSPETEEMRRLLDEE